MENKHLLNDTWTLWYAPRGRHYVHCKTEKYLSNLKILGDFHSIEEFFNFYCFLKKPSESPNDQKLMCFRKGCTPLWEEWKKGGCWIIQFAKKHHDHLIDKRWESLLFSCIGEELDDPRVIGVVLALRSEKNQLEIWLSSSNEESKLKVGEKARELLELDPHNLTLFYKENNVSLEEGGGVTVGAEGYSFILTPVQKEKEEEKKVVNLILDK